jgi:hypothetical protein
MLGGGLLVGLVYWSVYLREFHFSSLAKLLQLGFRLVFFVNPRTLSPRRIAANLSGFYCVLKRRKPGGRPIPRDLSKLTEEEPAEDRTSGG